MKNSTGKTKGEKFNLRRSALALAVATALGGGAASAWATVPTLAANAIVVNNNAQPNTITLTFNTALNAAANTAGNWVVTNNAGGLTYNIATAVCNSSTTVTLTLAAAASTSSTTFITNSAVNLGIKVTPSTTIADASHPAETYAGTTITASGASNTLDAIAPTVSTLAKNSTTTVTVSFNEQVDQASAETVGNYALAGTGGLTGNPSAAVLQASGTDVLLTVPTVAGFDFGNTLIVTVTGVKDIAGVAIAGTNTATYTESTNNFPPTLAANAIVVDNTVQPNTIAVTFNEALGVGATTAGNWTVTNSGATITYQIASAALSNANKTVTLTLPAVNPANSTTFITNAAADAHIKITPSTSIFDVDGATVAYAGSLVTESGGTLTKDATAPTVTTLAKNSATTVTLGFSEKVDAASAVVLTNYTLSGTGGLTGNPSVAVLQGSGKDVLLTVPTMAGFTGGQTLIATVTGVKDVAGITIVGTNTATYTEAPSITYSATTFTEAAANDGSITTSITLTLSGDLACRNLQLLAQFTSSRNWIQKI